MVRHLPEPVGGPAAWRGSEIVGRAEWMVRLADGEVAELRAAVATLGRPGLRLAEVGPDDLALPGLGERLAGLLDELVDGRGFVLLRGLPDDLLGERTAELTLWAVGVHLGIPIPQNARGELIVHVRDEGKDYDDPHVRSYETRAGLEYHSDSSDLVGLLCRRPARRGGVSTIVSAVAIHDALARERPELAALLHEPWWHDRRTGDGPESFFACEICALAGGRLFTHYGRAYTESAQRGPGVPALRPEQVEALDAYDRLASSPELVLDMAFEPGDLQILNNYTVLHARTPYEDWPDPGRRRDLCRIWLVLRRPLQLPPAFEAGGIVRRSVAFGPP